MENKKAAIPFVVFSKTFKVESVLRNRYTTFSPLCVEGEGFKTVKYVYQNAQGGCVANGYLYSCMHSPYVQPNKTVILKHELSKGKLLGYSAELEIGHANDATYVPEDNTIVISYCDGTTRMAILDADTLEHKETVTPEGHVLCNIHYDPVTKVFVSCAVQNEAIYVYDKEFKLINSFKAFMTPGPEVEYSMQGCITDGKYVYVLEWHGGQKWGELRGRGGATTESSTSHFNVFDICTGEHVAVIDTKIPREIEYAAYVDGKFLVGANRIDWRGLEVWEMTVTPEEESKKRNGDMATVRVDFQRKTGRIKPMHAVNNGPVKQYEVDRGRPENFAAYKEAGIPYARTHDASYYSQFGGEHSVDVHAIFPDFSKDPTDPASYDFTLTDGYLKNIVDAGTAVFYRLGSKIEHWPKKYGTLVPRDFHKWAVICEHIVRHYNEGWADGFFYGIEYWEIWNEADGVKSNGDQPNWSGSPEEFYRFYKVAATHLKKAFPHLKIGGPSVSSISQKEWLEGFFEALTADGSRAPLDFFSWHTYGKDPGKRIADRVEWARELLLRYGYTETQSIITEWNYVDGWSEGWRETVLGIIGMRGAAYLAAVMLNCQKRPVDMLMYYDARPCIMNGLFDYYTFDKLKGYYSIFLFSKLYRLGTECFCESDCGEIYAVAAADGKTDAVMLCCYREENTGSCEEVCLAIDGAEDGDRWTLKRLDGERTLEEEEAKVKNGVLTVTMGEDCVCYLERKTC